MSTTASVYVLRATELQAVTAAGPHGVLDALRARGQEVDDAYFWPGHNLLFVIRHLWDAEGLTLFSVLYRDQEQRLTDDKNVTIIIGPEHRQLLPQLEPVLGDAQLVASELERWGVSAAEAQVSASDALIMLYEQIADLPDDCVLVIHVG